MSVIVNCIVCGNPFSAYNRKADYCSTECKYMHDNELSRIKYRMDAEKKRRGNKKVKTLEEWEREARAAGMSYGQYRAMKGL